MMRQVTCNQSPVSTTNWIIGKLLVTVSVGYCICWSRWFRWFRWFHRFHWFYRFRWCWTWWLLCAKCSPKIVMLVIVKHSWCSCVCLVGRVVSCRSCLIMSGQSVSRSLGRSVGRLLCQLFHLLSQLSLASSLLSYLVVLMVVMQQLMQPLPLLPLQQLLLLLFVLYYRSLALFDC